MEEDYCFITFWKYILKIYIPILKNEKKKSIDSIISCNLNQANGFVVKTLIKAGKLAQMLQFDTFIIILINKYRKVVSIKRIFDLKIGFLGVLIYEMCF